MKTQFETETHKYEPKGLRTFNGKTALAWKVYCKRTFRSGNWYWMYKENKFHSPNATKKIIIQGVSQ
jgi:hypothetical protein